jgi:hypothetical protein
MCTSDSSLADLVKAALQGNELGRKAGAMEKKMY